MMARILGLVLVLLVLGAVEAGAQEIAPCVAITGADSTNADKCIPVPEVPVDTVTPPDTVVTPDPAVWSRAMGKWSPSRIGDCTKAQHDAYAVVGWGGKLYPTWHPPVEEGCTYGHEHGRDPAASPMVARFGPVLFGEVNEQQCDEAPESCRVEDHVGHKIEWGSLPVNPQNATVPAEPSRCDFLVKIHQGTHSHDAFTNNLHEFLYRQVCDNGFEADLRQLAAIGKAGTVRQQCGSQTIFPTGEAVPANSPTSSHPLSPGKAMGNRFLPITECVNVRSPNYHEVWKTQNLWIGPDGKQWFRAANYWNASDPSRIWDHGPLARTIDYCYARNTDGTFLITGNPCLTLRREMAGVPVAWDDERSPFKGAQRSIRFNDFAVAVPGDTGAVWYTDALGGRYGSSLTPLVGVGVRQYAKGRHSGVYAWTALNIGGNYDHPTVRAPN